MLVTTDAPDRKPVIQQAIRIARANVQTPHPPVLPTLPSAAHALMAERALNNVMKKDPVMRHASVKTLRAYQAKPCCALAPMGTQALKSVTLSVTHGLPVIAPRLTLFATLELHNSVFVLTA